MNSTITDQIDQIEKPTCSAKMDQIRLRLAICLPPASQAATSSASQCSMVRLRVKVVTGTSSTAGPFRFDCTAMSPMSTPAHIRATGSGARGDSWPTHRGNETETCRPQLQGG